MNRLPTDFEIAPKDSLLRATSREMMKDRFFYLFIIGYSLAAGLLAIVLGTQEKLIALIYMRKWFPTVMFLATVFVLVHAVRSLKSETPLASLKGSIGKQLSAKSLAGILLFTWMAIYHGVFTSVKTMLIDIQTFVYDPALANLDAAMHGGVDPWKLIPHSFAATRIIQWLYITVWLAVLAIFSLWVLIKAEREVRNRYLWTFLISWILLGNIIAGMFMSAGPVYYENVTGEPRFAELMNYLEQTRDRIYSSINVQDRLWSIHERGIVEIGSGISAFPSMHIAMATLWTLTAWQMMPRLKWAFLAFLAVIQIGSVHLGWHYAIDGYFSAIVVIGLWLGIRALQRRPRKPVTQ